MPRCWPRPATGRSPHRVILVRVAGELILDTAERVVGAAAAVRGGAGGYRRPRLHSGDGNPLDAWGNGVRSQPVTRCACSTRARTMTSSCSAATAEDQPFETPGLVQTYLDLFTKAAADSRKPHYLLHTRPGSWTEKP
jgi:hypothetical protein